MTTAQRAIANLFSRLDQIAATEEQNAVCQISAMVQVALTGRRAVRSAFSSFLAR